MDKQGEEKKELSRCSCYNNDMVVCDVFCDVCIYRIQGDEMRCQKYPEGKPDEVLDPDYYCPECKMTPFGF